MKVKICGITDIRTALHAVKTGADALGFVFAESKRQISREQSKGMIKQLSNSILKVGVFVNEPIDVVREIVEETGLTAIQLHGDEGPEYCQAFTIPVIKALSIASTHDLKRIQQYPCEYILLDSPKGKYQGGNGVKFDWGLLHEIDYGDKKIILAGGLNPENVANAINEVQPYMVDVSSGVETEGNKDYRKIQRFIENAKSQEEIR